MNGIVNENQLSVEYKFDNLLTRKIDALIDNSIRDCYDNYFHTFHHVCEYDLNFTIFSNNETVNFTISDKCMGIYELDQKLAIARENGFRFNQLYNFKINFMVIYLIKTYIII